MANASNNLALLLLDAGKADQARSLLEEALAIHRQIGDPWSIGNTLNNLGNVMRELFDQKASGKFYAESLVISHDLEDKWALAYLLEDIGQLAARLGEAEREYRLVGAAASLRHQIGSPLTSAEESAI